MQAGLALYSISCLLGDEGRNLESSDIFVDLRPKLHPRLLIIVISVSPQDSIPPLHSIIAVCRKDGINNTDTVTAKKTHEDETGKGSTRQIKPSRRKERSKASIRQQIRDYRTSEGEGAQGNKFIPF